MIVLLFDSIYQNLARVLHLKSRYAAVSHFGTQTQMNRQAVLFSEN